ncbi:DNA-binding GntR family transcriptional regulator [Microbacterium endophyticum]|uniref:DNA-binding GntR family transcriptional regulator n=1 Tax=Microbacterium endophyticum TaxID=1526412 RepID=A0A7W4V1W5_9MICO|nr:GntR family transcriptional regulator [Microbacterium endophyticum]MBB2975346.1 DNA-binding GntR family transcriptional regulator [Microbacterium endophyticum]NIK35635.1 DNA-binding GntR family transcriptional regulator [Microbacterium endophyticum]
MPSTEQLDVTDASGHALVDEIAAKIRARIMSGDIPIGSQLRQAELATDFGVSRTPIREALRQLQTGGLIDVVPNRGAVVRVPSPWEVREAYEVRAELEALAASRAVSRISRGEIERLRTANQEMFDRSAAESDASADPSTRRDNDVFHTTITSVSSNARLARSIDEINENFPRNVSAQLLTNDARHREENFHEHGRIIDALERGDEEAAAREMREHVLKAGEQLARWYERRSSTVFRG